MTREWLKRGGLVALGAGLGVLGTAWLRPAKVVEKTRTVDRVVQVKAESRAEIRQEAKQETVERVRVVYRWRKPDGSEVTKETESEGRRTETERRGSSEDRRVLALRHEQIAERVKLIERSAPNWGIGAQAGLRLGDLKPVFGGEVSRRVVGPVWLGAWANTSGAFGLSARVEF